MLRLSKCSKPYSPHLPAAKPGVEADLDSKHPTTPATAASLPASRAEKHADALVGQVMEDRLQADLTHLADFDTEETDSPPAVLSDNAPAERDDSKDS